MVTNEVGMGIVPANDLARAFRDVLGTVNATFAGSAERAVLMVAGQALELTSALPAPRGGPVKRGWGPRSWPRPRP